MFKYLVVFAMLASLANAHIYDNEIGSVSYGEYMKSSPINFPVEDVVLALPVISANGGKKTVVGSSIANMGIRVEIYQANIFQQIKDYTSGKSPFILASFDEIALAAQYLNAGQGTKPVAVMLQVQGAPVYKVILKDQPQGSPNIFAFEPSGKYLSFAQTMDNAEIMVGRLTGGFSAALMDEINLSKITGGLDLVGTGAEGTVAGAKVDADTKFLSKQILLCREDFFTKNKQIVEKLVLAILMEQESYASGDRVSATIKYFEQFQTDLERFEAGHDMQVVEKYLKTVTFAMQPEQIEYFFKGQFQNDLTQFQTFLRSRGYIENNDVHFIFSSRIDYSSDFFIKNLKVLHKNARGENLVKKEISTPLTLSEDKGTTFQIKMAIRFSGNVSSDTLKQFMQTMKIAEFKFQVENQ